MTGDEGLFASLDHYDNPTETIIYGDNGQGDVIGLGKIVISTANSIEDVYHVQGVVWTSLGPLPWRVLGLTTRWVPGTTRLVPHDT
jgi:hypothetical protein